MSLCGALTKAGTPCKRSAGRCPDHLDVGGETTGATVRGEVDRALAGIPADWRTALARKLAETLDSEPNASMARELRAVMTAIAAASPARREGTPLDELDKRRAARQPGPDVRTRAGGGVVGGR